MLLLKLRVLLAGAARLLLSKLSSVCPKSYVLYGSGFGQFSGHTKHRFLEYYSLECSYWVASNGDTAQLLSQLGLRCVRKNGLRHFLIALQSDKAFITHNVSDVFPVKLSSMEVINLWHGVPMKSIGFDSPVELEWINRKVSVGEVLPYDEWDIFVAQSLHHKKIVESAMRIEASKIVVEEPCSIRVIRSMQHKRRNREKPVFLYLPTFRNDGSDEEVVAESIDRIIDHFGTGMCVLQVKCHPLVAKSVETMLKGRFVVDVEFLDSGVDVFDLLGSVESLITDYSSAAYDFYSATGRPVYLIQCDLDKYIEKNGPLYPVDFESYCIR